MGHSYITGWDTQSFEQGNLKESLVYIITSGNLKAFILHT